VQFTADRETHAQLEELRALMRHQVPDGDVGKILAKAISVLLKHVRKQKFRRNVRAQITPAIVDAERTTYPRGDPASCLAARRRTLHLCLGGRPAL
jgi:hypothetical protein